MTKPPILTICSIALLCSTLPSFAGDTGDGSSLSINTVASSASNEIARRQEQTIQAQADIARGDEAMSKKDYETAVAQYKAAVDLLPESRETGSLHARALDSFCNASVKLAEQRISEGRYADAESVLKTVLRPSYDPECKSALVVLSRLEAPDYYNKTITPGFRAKVEKVKQLLTDAQGFSDTGRYDLAIKRYEQVLNLDPYNIAARKGEELVNKQRYEYGEAGYNHTRSELLWDVEKGWDLPVRKFAGSTTEASGNGQTISGTEYISNKLDKIIIPSINFNDATVADAIAFIRKKAYDLDTTPDPTQRGVNIVLKLNETNSTSAMPATTAPVTPETPGAPTSPMGEAAAPAINPAEARVTLSLNQSSVGEALNYVAKLAGLKVRIDPHAVFIVPLNDTDSSHMITRTFRVSPSMFANSSSSSGSNPLAQNPVSPIGTTPGAGGPGAAPLTGNQSAMDYFKANGVEFPPGATASYFAASSKLVVRNTQSNLDLIDQLVQVGQSVPSQIKIEAKFVEVQQTNMKELGFDWLLGQSSMPGSSSKIFYGGGASATGSSGAYPFVNPGTGVPTGGNLLTSGNRSGGMAISQDAISSLLAASTGGLGAVGPAPATFGIAGVYTDPNFQLVIRAINQKKGVDLLSAPSVTTKSGQPATVKVVEEFIYPNSFTPPTIPTSTGINNGGGGFLNPITGIFENGGGQGAFPVTPTTPSSFATRNTGVSLQVQPTLGPDGSTIDMQLNPEVVEFEGFINYGSPIQTQSTNPITGIVTTNVLTPNVINQPIFSTRSVTTNVSVADGSTVILGGLIREDVQKTEDKIPFLGDLPLIGRLFRDQAEQHTKRDLVIFVTANLLNSSGQLLQPNEQEQEETVQPLTGPDVAPPLAPPLPETGYSK